VLTAGGGLSGALDSVVVDGGLPRGLVANAQVDATSLTVSIGENCPGDTNGDGVVSLGDFSTVLSNFGGLANGPADGDLNADGVVSLADFSVVLSSFGSDCNED